MERTYSDRLPPLDERLKLKKVLQGENIIKERGDLEPLWLRNEENPRKKTEK